MSRLLAALLVIVAALAAGGCAHPISLQSDTTSLVGSGGGRKIERKVALAIPEARKAQEVTTPGGGGDKVSYFPYRDLQTGLYIALGETFSSVILANGPQDPKIAQEGATLVLTPDITTTSHSPSLLTWPPTIFGITIELKATAVGNPVAAEVRAQGEGRAEFDEFKADFSLSAKRAAQDVLKKLIQAIQASADKLR